MRCGSTSSSGRGLYSSFSSTSHGRDDHSVGFELGEVQHVVDELEQCLAAGGDGGQRFGAFLFVRDPADEQFGVADDGVERGADVMADRREEEALGACRLDFLVERGMQVADGELAVQRGFKHFAAADEEVFFVDAEGTVRGVGDAEVAPAFSADFQRDEHEGLARRDMDAGGTLLVGADNQAAAAAAELAEALVLELIEEDGETVELGLGAFFKNAAVLKERVFRFHERDAVLLVVLRDVDGVRGKAFQDDAQDVDRAGNDVFGLEREERLRDGLGVLVELVGLRHVDRAFQDVLRIAVFVADRLRLDREILTVAPVEQERLRILLGMAQRAFLRGRVVQADEVAAFAADDVLEVVSERLERGRVRGHDFSVRLEEQKRDGGAFEDLRTEFLLGDGPEHDLLALVAFAADQDHVGGLVYASEDAFGEAFLRLPHEIEPDEAEELVILVAERRDDKGLDLLHLEP